MIKAYDRVGINKSPALYDKIAAEECAKMQKTLAAVAIENGLPQG